MGSGWAHGRVPNSEFDGVSDCRCKQGFNQVGNSCVPAGGAAGGGAWGNAAAAPHAAGAAGAAAGAGQLSAVQVEQYNQQCQVTPLSAGKILLHLPCWTCTAYVLLPGSCGDAMRSDGCTPLCFELSRSSRARTGSLTGWMTVRAPRGRSVLAMTAGPQAAHKQGRQLVEVVRVLGEGLRQRVLVRAALEVEGRRRGRRVRVLGRWLVGAQARRRSH